MKPDLARINAFRSAILNTVVRIVRPSFEGLTLSNCMQSPEFVATLKLALRQPLLSVPVEPAMDLARDRLLIEVG